MTSKIPPPPIGTRPEIKLSASEAKAAATDLAARSITAAEREKVRQKTENLRSARLAKEAEDRKARKQPPQGGAGKSRAASKTKKRA